MQDDLIVSTFSPREVFTFVANLRLPSKSEGEKIYLVNNLIDTLGLNECADTRIGDSMSKGISGGERRRTSIGIDLITNPSLIFLDEPTTGLDSVTALNLIKLLNGLAESGKTVVSTIHQPSSELFSLFDKIILMVDGHVIYHDDAKKSINYFKKIGMPIPLHSNPVEHYMELLNKEGIMLHYIER